MRDDKNVRAYITHMWKQPWPVSQLFVIIASGESKAMPTVDEEFAAWQETNALMARLGVKG